MVEHGVDAVEIGLPYSDPVMDGPVIQAASQIAIDNGEKIANVFKAVETVANAGGVPPGDELLEPHLPLRRGTFRTQF